jgi:hypothetical protein
MKNYRVQDVKGIAPGLMPFGERRKDLPAARLACTAAKWPCYTWQHFTFHHATPTSHLAACPESAQASSLFPNPFMAAL